MPGSWMGSHFCTQRFLGKDAFLTEMSALHYGIEFSESQSKATQISRLSNKKQANKIFDNDTEVHHTSCCVS